ncbi:MAG: nuclear transport factor 2 family protein [bacterium]|nr:nuclear transport factor 2 family protein [bacterium]
MSKRPDTPLTRETMGIAKGLPLNLSGDGIEDLRRGIQTLMDIEAIKQLKHAYFRCLDTANFEEMADLFHEDVSVHFIGGAYEWKLQGRAEYIEAVSKAFTKQAIGHHNGHHPEIQILNQNEATGIWYLADHMWILEHNFHTTGTALYYDRYLKRDGRWQVKDTQYRRIYESSRRLDENPPLSTHYLGTYGSGDTSEDGAE